MIESLRAFFVRRWKILVAVLGTIVVLLIGGFVALPAPHAEGALKGHTVELSRNGDIRIVFDQRMDHGSVEGAFHISPSIEGTFSWQDNQLTFKHQQDFNKGQNYDVIIDTTARSLWLKPLAESYRQTFTILDYPEVAVVAPVDQSIVMQDQILTVLFDHPVRNLTGSLAVPLELLVLDPAIKGELHWLGTSGFEFVPTEGWHAATTYKATVPKGTKMADGGSTIEDKTWSFATPRLTVSLDVEKLHHKPQVPVRLVFNYPIRPEVLRNKLQVNEGETRIASDQFIFGSEKDHPEIVTVLKKGGYQLGKIYTFALEKDFTAEVGPTGLASEWKDSFVMDELGFKMKLSLPVDGGEKQVHESVTVCFNNPVDEGTFAKGVRMIPALDGQGIYPYGYAAGCTDGAASISINGNWKPSTDYTLTLNSNLADVYGQKLNGAITIKFKTSPYPASFEVSNYSANGVLSAYLPRIYQARTLNWDKPVLVSVSSSSDGIKSYLTGAQYDGEMQGQKSYDTSAKLNTYKILNVDLDEVAGRRLPNGFYRLDFNDRPNYHERGLIIVDTALTLKRDRTGKVLVWATDLKTGGVVANLNVEVWDGRYVNGTSPKRLAEGKTDAQGIAVIQMEENTKVDQLSVIATDKIRLGYAETSWNDGIGPWNYGLDKTYDTVDKFYIGYVYTDRRIYRPDQNVAFKGVVRFDDDASLSLPKIKEVNVKVEDPEGNQIWSQKLPLNEYGTFNGSLQLEPSMKLGAYRIVAALDDAQFTRVIDGSFDVREYRKPDFKIDLNAPAGTITAGDKLEIPVHVEYYQGVPLKGGKVHYEITRTKLSFQPFNGNWWNDWYSFSEDEGMDCYWYCRTEGGFENVQSGDAELDANGNLMLTVPANLTDYKGSATYSVSVTVTDINQRQVSSQTEFAVHRGEFYVGIRPDYSDGWSSLKADFNLATVNADGSIRPNTAMTIQLFKRTWSSVKKTGTDGASFYEWQVSEALVDTRSATTDEKGKGNVSFTPSSDGEYRAVVSATDARGRTISASSYRYVYRGEGGTVRVSDDHQMQIVQNKASYEVGDTASLAIQTPYVQTKALVTVERNTIREYRVIDLGSKNRTVDIKIKEEDTPNVYVSVLAAKGGEADIPEFRMAYANLQVNTTKKILNMTVTPDKATYKPGERVTLTVETKNSEGKPVQTEASIAVVDERVIALLGTIDKNILGKFWFPRLIGVDTAQTLTMLVKKVYFATEGGSGKGDGGGVPPIRGNFQDTAYWNATVTTGADGKAQVSFDLPDNLTSWNILAIGETKDTVVGSAEAKIVTRRELMAEPLLPRLLRHQDTASVGATIINGTAAAMDVDVSLEAIGVTLSGGSKRVHLNPMDRTVVTWMATVPRDGAEAQFTLTAKGTGGSDAFTVKIPLLDYSVAETVSTSGILERSVTETLEVPDGIMPNVGQVDVSVQPNIGNGLQKSLDYLTTYPYACSEQKASGLMGNLMYQQLAKLKVMKADPGKEEQAVKDIRDGIKSLVSTQHGDGGWGWWPEYESSPWLTAYVFWGLTQSEKAGFEVDKGTMDRADAYLKQALAVSDSNYHPFGYTGRAQVVFMLAERNPDGLSGYAASLYEHRDALPVFAKLFLAMAYHDIEKNVSSARATTLITEAQNRVIYLNPSTAYVKDDIGYDEYLSSDLRTTSLYLQTLLRIDPGSKEIERLLRYIMQNREEGRWYTTQETSMTLLGLVEYARKNPVETNAQQVSLFVDNMVKATLSYPEGDVSGPQSKSFSLSELSKGGATHQIGIEKDSDKRYFYDIDMKVYREIQNIQPFDNGFSVIADTYALDDGKFEHPIATAKQGDTVRVRVKLLVPKRHRYVALEYHLPAGLEAIDFQLKTSPQQLADKEQQCYPGWNGKQQCLSDWQWGWWWENVWKHIEMRDDRVFLFSENLEPGVYEYTFLAQAMTTGDYRVPPARAYEFYNPKANAHNEGKLFKVTER